MKNREIKFRAYVTNKGWIQGFNLINCHRYFTKGLEPKLSRYDSEWNIKDIHLMQFTGLKDKKGIDIYEGDILMTTTGICSVIWSDASFPLLSPGSEAVDWEHSSVYELSEIIGNIHENPELLNH